MLEVEVKYRSANWQNIQEQLQVWGATRLALRDDVDQYFNAPDRDFAKTDEAVRIRSIGRSNYLTYKGPKREAETKTRYEVEVPLADGVESAELARQWLLGLGYRSVATVRKSRQVWSCERDGFHLEICLDDVPAVGQFVELEIQADEERFEQAKQTLLSQAKELGLVEQERRSYLELTLQNAKQSDE